MANSFESRFSEYQAGMINVCLEYCQYKCDKVYVHIINGKDSVFTNFFFSINGILRKKSNLGDSDATVSMPRQKEALKIVSDNAKKIYALFEEYKRPTPTELKIVYDARSKGLKADYSYEPVVSADKPETAVTEAWFNEIGLTTILPS